MSASSTDSTKSCTFSTTWRVASAVPAADVSMFSITEHSFMISLRLSVEANHEGMKRPLLSTAAQQRSSSRRKTEAAFMTVAWLEANSSDVLCGTDRRAWIDCTVSEKPVLLGDGSYPSSGSSDAVPGTDGSVPAADCE